MSKKIAIMQPYFMPYIGYFQLMNSVDEFIIYDNIQYTKKGWINRNRILINGKDHLITVPLKKDSDYLNVIDRSISDSWIDEKRKILNTINTSYRNAPFYNSVIELLDKCFSNDEKNLFKFIYDSIVILNDYLEIKTPIIISSSVNINHELKSQDKVIALCKDRSAEVYINSIGGIELYDRETFLKNGIQLNFIKSNSIKYKQFEEDFVPWLSIIDVLMFNSKDDIKDYLKNYSII